MAEETIRYNVEYEVTGIDSSVRNTQRLLYAMNAVRLSVRDIQEVMAGPTLQNVMWTAIQLTRVWTTLWRLVQAVNKEQKLGLAMGVGRTAAQAGTGALGQTVLSFGAGGQLGVAAQSSLFATVLNTLAIPGVGIAVGAAAATVGLVAWDMNQRQARSDWLQRQREAAKSQGIEY